MKSRDTTHIDTENKTLESIKQAKEASATKIRDLQQEAEDARREAEELERELMQAEEAERARKEAAEKGQETKEKIDAIAER